MLKELFSNRLFIGALAFFILSVVGGMLYISHVEKQGAEKLATDKDRVKQVTEKQQQQPTAKAPVGDTSQGGHVHADGTWHEGAHEPIDAPPVLPPRQVPETPKFVKPVSDSQHITIADKVKASGTVPDRAELEAMSDKQLTKLMEESYEKVRELSPKWENAMSEWAEVHADLTRHAKPGAETDAILAKHADRIKPFREAMEAASYEYLGHSITFNRASKILQARFLMEHEPQTDAFWTNFWANF